MVETTSKALHPEVKWGNMRRALWVTIEVPDVVDEDLKVTETGLKFKGKKGDTGMMYAVDIEFYDKVDADNLKNHSTKRHVQLEIPKKQPGHWPHFMKEKRKENWLSSDFQHFEDEDESEEEADMGMGGMPGLGGMGGMPGMGGQDFSSLMKSMKGMEGVGDDIDYEGDSDDEELPDLEKPDDSIKA